MRKEVTHNGVTYIADMVNVRTTEGIKELRALLVNDLFVVHMAWQSKEDIEDKIDPLVTITHKPSGYAILPGLNNLNGAFNIATRLYNTLSAEQRALWNNPDLTPDMEAIPKKHMKAVAKYLTRAKKAENNAELERMVGVFYKDREEVERLRLKINPPANTLMDDKAIGSERLTGSLIMGEFELSK